MKILLTGGTGFIGNRLTRMLIDKGHEVRILTRDIDVHHPFYHWDQTIIDEKVFKDLDGIIHLAGAPLMKRWTTNFKKEILRSRVETANLLFKQIVRNKININFFISASGSSYYGQSTTEHIYLETDEMGNDFLAEVCKYWEEAAMQFQQLGARVVCLRTPLVLSEFAPSFQLMKNPTSKGVGTCLGSGEQWVSWIHLDDLCRLYVNAVENVNFQGPINAVAPQYINHQEFMKQLAAAYQTQIYLPHIPAFFVKIAMGEKANLVLEGARLSNQKLQDLDFSYKFPTLNEFFRTLN